MISYNLTLKNSFSNYLNGHLLYSYTLICLTFIVVIVLSKIIMWYLNIRPKWKLLSLIPGPPPHLLFGNFDVAIYNSLKYSDWSQRSFEWLNKIAHQYGTDGVLRLWGGPFTGIVLLTSPETAETVLSNVNHTDRSLIYKIFKPFLGHGLGTSNGIRWRNHRKLLNPAFNYRILENFLPIIDEQQKVFLNVIEEKTKNTDGIVEDIRPLLSMFVLDTLCETTMGVKLNSQTKSEPKYLKTLGKLIEIGLHILIRPWYWNINILSRTTTGKKAFHYVKTLHNFTDNVIRERKAEILEKIDSVSQTSAAEQLQENYGQKRQLAFLDLILSHHLKNPTAMSEYHVRSEVDTFMFAGHHTTATSLSWTLMLIGNHPEVQEKIHNELDLLFPSPDDININLGILREIKYLECVIKESLRLYPSAVIIGRQNNREFHCGKYKIPADTLIGIFIYHIHRLEKYFPNPESFIPERFLPENPFNNNNNPKDYYHPYAFIPFSAGPRNCIGQKYSMMQQKAFLATVLRKYKITSLIKREDVTIGVDFVLAPKSEISIQFKRRT